MNILDDMPLEEAIKLYYEKHHAIRQGDMTKLRELRQYCPEIFDNEKDAQIRNIIEYAKKFQKTDRYKELLRLKMRERFSIVKNDEIEE